MLAVGRILTKLKKISTDSIWRNSGTWCNRATLSRQQFIETHRKGCIPCNARTKGITNEKQQFVGVVTASILESSWPEGFGLIEESIQENRSDAFDGATVTSKPGH